MKPKPARARGSEAEAGNGGQGHYFASERAPIRSVPFDVANQTIYVDDSRINSALSATAGHGSSNPTPEAYTWAVDALARAKADQTVVYQPRITIDSLGQPRDRGWAAQVRRTQRPRDRVPARLRPQAPSSAVSTGLRR